MTSQATDTRRKRLLVLASTYPRWRGDPEPGFVHSLALRLAARFDVVVLTPHAPGAAERECLDGVDVVRYRYAPARLESLVNDGGIIGNLRGARWKWLLVPGFVTMLAWKTWQMVRKEEIDVIHAHWMLPQGLAAALLQFIPGASVPYVVTSHGADLYALHGGAMNALKRFVLRHAAAATVVSSPMRRSLQSLGADASHVAIHPMGVDLAGRFRPDKTVRRSEHEILFVGRLVEKKGLRYLLDAMPAVLRRMPMARLTVAGFGPDAEDLGRQVQRLGLADAVRFVGAVPQAGLPDLYRHAAVFVAPFVRANSGDQEGLGLVLVEAIGCGCPVLAGNVGAVRDVLGEHFDELAVDPTDAGALASRLVEMLAEPDVSRERSARLRESCVRKFGWEDVAEAYAALLTRAAEGGPP